MQKSNIKYLPGKISSWIKWQVDKAGANGIVVGLSGGLDSSVVAVLSKMAMGERVLGLIIPCHSDKSDEEDVKLLAEKFDIKTERIVLDHPYDRLLELLSRSSPFGPEGIFEPKAHQPLTEGAGKAYLRRKVADAPKLWRRSATAGEASLTDRICAVNLKPRLRMLTLYYFANKFNHLVAGCGNKSELMVGYFTKYGDGGADILPIGGFLKTQVIELAKELKIQQKIIEKVPSAGLWESQTDEVELGISYKELDKTIIAIENRNYSGTDPKVISKVKKLIQSSHHKRLPIPIFKIQNY